MNLKDIEGLSDADKLALVKSIQESVAANKAKQVSLEAGQYAKLVVEAVKKIKTDLEARYSEIKADIDSKAAKLKDGKDGLQGPKGEKGDRGFDGINGKDGRDGKDGKDGVDGSDGLGVADAHIDFDGALVITLTNGREINAGEVVPFDVAEKIKVIGNGGGTSQYVLDAISDLQTQIAAISPTLVITDTFVVSSQAAMLALSTAEKGDVAVRTDLNKTFILKQDPYSTLANWQELLTPTDLVTSVAGRTGNVTLSNTDVSGLGTMSTQSSSSVSITGGSISGITDLAVVDGGTGASTASGARTNLGLVIGTDVLAPNGSAASLTNFPTLNQNTTGTASNVTGIVAVLNGGTGSTTASGARTNLGLVIGTDVLAPNGSAASLTSFPTLNQNTTGSAGSLVTTGFSITESGGKLLIKYGATTIASISSTGVITSAVNIVSNGTP
jgi:Collagen triple helix repeat (20 copies)